MNMSWHRNFRQLTSSVSVKLRESKLLTAGITSLKLQRRGIFFHMRHMWWFKCGWCRQVVIHLWLNWRSCVRRPNWRTYTLLKLDISRGGDYWPDDNRSGAIFVSSSHTKVDTKTAKYPSAFMATALGKHLTVLQPSSQSNDPNVDGLTHDKQRLTTNEMLLRRHVTIVPHKSLMFPTFCWLVIK